MRLAAPNRPERESKDRDECGENLKKLCPEAILINLMAIKSWTLVGVGVSMSFNIYYDVFYRDERERTIEEISREQGELED